MSTGAIRLAGGQAKDALEAFPADALPLATEAYEVACSTANPALAVLIKASLDDLRMRAAATGS